MEISKKYWIFAKKFVIVYDKKSSWFRFILRKTDEYWILFVGKILISNDVIKLNKDWGNL
jgi:hypothetical protein